MLTKVFNQIPSKPVFPYIAGSLVSLTTPNPIRALIKLYEEFSYRIANSDEIFVYFLAQYP